MPFIVTEVWTKNRWDTAVDVVQAIAGWIIPSVLSQYIPNNVKRPMILTLSTSANAAFFYAIISQGMAPQSVVRESQDSLIAVFDFIAPETPKEVEPTPEKQAAKKGNISPQIQPVEMTSTLAVKEWSISKVSISQDTELDAIGSDGKADIGNGVYDPYAGASPQLNPHKQATYITDYSDMDPEFDIAMFEKWITKLRARLRRANGSVMLSVTLRGDGSIANAEIMGGSANKQLQLFVRSDAMGQKLFRSGSGKKNLPEIRL